MASQNNIYPLFFILERVRNGYILTAKEETGGLKEAEFRKEVVSEDKINARIGQMLHLDAMVKERPVVFHVEAVGESTYQMANERSSDELTEAKLAYVHINSKDIKDGSILSLLIKDTDSIEVYGFEAERAATVQSQWSACAKFSQYQGWQESLGDLRWQDTTHGSQHPTAYRLVPFPQSIDGKGE